MLVPSAWWTLRPPASADRSRAGAPLIRPVTPVTPGFDALVDLARAEGHAMLDRLAQEWASGVNRFDAPGECYLGLWMDGELRAVGGLNRDRYEGGADSGRLRHVYVHVGYRRASLGSLLVGALIAKACPHFRTVRLRTGNPAAAALYEALGFFRVSEPFATHRLAVPPQG